MNISDAVCYCERNLKSEANMLARKRVKNKEKEIEDAIKHHVNLKGVFDKLKGNKQLPPKSLIGSDGQ
eukprot:10404065-Karenia_brevis.AAC.1